MKKDYSTLLSTIRKKDRPKYIFLAFMIIMILASLAFLPISCEPLTGSYVNIEGKRICVRRCWSIYNTEMSVTDMVD